MDGQGESASASLTQDDVAVTGLPQIAAPENSSPNTFAVRGFQRGFDPRRNTAGRIKKKPTVWDETVKLAERKRKQVARAYVATMEQETAAGVRQREVYLDRTEGTVAHRMVVEHEDAAGMAWLEALARPYEELPADGSDG